MAWRRFPIPAISSRRSISLPSTPSLRFARPLPSPQASYPTTFSAAGWPTPASTLGVLDYFALKILGRDALVQVIVLNASTADQTVAYLAGKVGQALIDLVAQNEQRLLRHPAIIGAMYTNKKARMSTVDRAVELAVRHEIKVPGIAAWSEITQAVLGKAKSNEPEPSAAAMDKLFEDVAGGEIQEVGADGKVVGEAKAEEPREDTEIALRDMTIPMKIRAAQLGNKTIRAQLIRDPLKMVASARIKAPGVTELEAAKYASNSALCDDVIQYISTRRDWTKLYESRYPWCRTPRPPSLLQFVSCSICGEGSAPDSSFQGVPTAISAQAKKLVMARQRDGGK